MTNLVSTITQVLSSDIVARIASKLGIDEAQVTRAFQAGVPGLLAALASLVSKPQGASALSKAVAQQEPGALTGLAGLLGGAGQKALVEGGANTLTSLLGGQTASSLIDAVGKYAGIGTTASKSVMGLLGPVALGVLGQQQRSHGLDAAGIGDLLASQKDNIARALPSGFTDYLTGTGILDGVAAKPARFEPAYVAPQQRESNLGWMLPVLALVALGGLAWALLRGPHPEVAAVSPSAVEAPGKAADRPAFIVAEDEVKNWITRPVFSSDDKKIGEIVEIKRGPDNKVIEATIDTGSFLGIGATRYRVMSEQIREFGPDGVKLTLKEAEVSNAIADEKHPQ